MIVEIALGIVLAVIILAFLPLIIAAGVTILGVLVLFVVGGLMIYWALNSSDSFLAAVAIGGVIAAGATLAHYIAKKTVLRAEEAGGLMVVAVVLGFVGFSLFEQYQKYGDVSAEALNLLPFLVLLAVLGAVLWRRAKNRTRVTQHDVQA